MFLLLGSSLKFLAVIVKFFIIQVCPERLLKNIISAGFKKKVIVHGVKVFHFL